ncbi:MAG: hypothetical protein ACO3VQ_05820 [Ilumatobacteraceae bacterium]
MKLFQYATTPTTITTTPCDASLAFDTNGGSNAPGTLTGCGGDTVTIPPTPSTPPLGGGDVEGSQPCDGTWRVISVTVQLRPRPAICNADMTNPEPKNSFWLLTTLMMSTP